MLLGAGVLVMAVAVAVLSAGIWALHVADDAPALDELKPIRQGQNSVVFAADGTRLGVIGSDTARKVTPLRRIPKVLRNATVAIEDASFYEHGGVDFSAIARAAAENVEQGQVVQGGSTITQQLIKNIYTGRLDNRDLRAKIQEAKLAEDLEQRFSKDEILERYLNSASYGTNGGRDSIGVGASARTYFDKPVDELRLKEAALLAGLPQAPSLHNPLINPRPAKRRRDDVLRAMANQGYVSEARAERLIGSGLGVHPTSRYDEVREQYFFDYVFQQVVDAYGIDKVRKGGLKVYTTIDLDKQQEARRAIDGRLSGVGPSAALVTTSAATGNVLAMVSSSNYEDSKFNLAAQGQRQPGSSFKTMVLTAALRQGADPEKTYYRSSSPLQIDDPRVGSWEVNTFSNTSGGTLNLRQATLASDNVVYAQLDLDVGPDAVTETARDMGITSKLNSYPAEGIGGLEVGVTPLEMSNAYGTLASGGIRRSVNAIKRVEFPGGRVDRPKSGKREKRVFPDGVASKVTDILGANVRGGTGTNAQIGCPQAGKTGTTDSFRDAWFVGYTPRLSTSVWVGYPDQQTPMLTEYNGGSVAGGSYPALIWGDYMGAARDGYCGGFPSPTSPFKAKAFDGPYEASQRARRGGGSGRSPN